MSHGTERLTDANDPIHADTQVFKTPVAMTERPHSNFMRFGNGKIERVIGLVAQEVNKSGVQSGSPKFILDLLDIKCRSIACKPDVDSRECHGLDSHTTIVTIGDGPKHV